MNMGMSFNKRPDAKAPSKMGGMSFQRMARQMGLDPEEMGEEAENMWAMLDDMSTNDPAAYKEYIALPPATPSGSVERGCPLW